MTYWGILVITPLGIGFFWWDRGGFEYLGCSSIDPLFRIGVVDAPTYLQSSWPCGQSFFSSFFVVGPEHDDMSAC